MFCNCNRISTEEDPRVLGQKMFWKLNKKKEKRKY